MSSKRVNIDRLSLTSLRVTELKRMCREKNLPATGKKDDLLCRLRNHMEQEGDDELEYFFSFVRRERAARTNTDKLIDNAPGEVQRAVASVREAAQFPLDSDAWQSLKRVGGRLPGFCMANAIEYFIMQAALDTRPSHNFKAISEHALLLFSNGLIQRLQLASHPKNSDVFLRCICLPEMRKDKPYSLSMKLDQTASIHYAECACPAGKPPRASCKHIAAMCYALEEFVRLGYNRDKVTCTDKLASWNCPRQKSVEPGLLKDVMFAKSHYNPTQTDSVTTARPMQHHSQFSALHPSPEAVTAFAIAMRDLSSTGAPAAFLDVLPPLPVVKARQDRTSIAREKQALWKDERDKKRMSGNDCFSDLAEGTGLHTMDTQRGSSKIIDSDSKSKVSCGPATGDADKPVFSLPWGGYVDLNDKRVYFSDTCPLDNFLAILYFLLDSNPVFLSHIRKLQFCKLSPTITDIYEALKSGRWRKAKYLWIHQLFENGRAQLSGSEMNVVNLNGSEYERFLYLYSPELMCFSTAATCSHGCRFSKENIGWEIFLRTAQPLHNLPPDEQVQVMWHIFLHPPDEPCRPRCGGVRSMERRTFFFDLGGELRSPMMLIMAFAEEDMHNISISEPHQLPKVLSLPPTPGCLESTIYSLFAVTYNNSTHFNCSIYLNSQWFRYDGLANDGKLEPLGGEVMCPGGYKMGHFVYKLVSSG